MPTYDYHCDHCGEMEIVQRMTEDALTACPQCGSTDFRKLVSSGAGVIFKGDGFWETDYNRSSDYQSKAKAESSGGDASSASASEAKGSSDSRSSSDSSSAKTTTATSSGDSSN